MDTTYHRRRRINTEDKAKVIAAVWGTEFSQLLATLGNFTTIGRKE